MDAVKTLYRRLRSEYGAELIEMAIVAPLLMMLLAAMFDFGFAFRNWEVVTNAAREGARIGVLPGYNCSPGAGVAGDVEARVQDYMTGAGFPNTSDYTIEVGTTTVGSFTSCVVRVSMFQQLSSLGVIAQFFGGNFTSIPLVAAAVMRTEVQAGP